MPTIAGFLPSRSGFDFANSFPNVPLVTIDVGVAKVPIGSASNGMCGGMVFTVRDYFHAGATPPPGTTPPTSGPLYDFIVNRLVNSFDLPGGPLRYLHLMNPDLPDHETTASSLGLLPHGRAWVMIVEEWPKIRADIDSGVPSPLALVQVKSHDPFQMGHNHQVLVYGYELHNDDLTLKIYDPNFPNVDQATISLNISRPQNTTDVHRTHGSDPIYCFFRTPYTYVQPPDRWESLGGVLTSGPTVSSWAPGRLDVFARGTDNSLCHKWYDGNWSGWESLGGVLTSDPAAVSWSLGRIDVFARGTDNSLCHKWYDGNWSGWESLGGVLTSGPTVSSWAPGRLDVFARGTDNAMWHRWYDGNWSGWESLGGVLTSDPAAVSWSHGRIDVFARGTDNSLCHKWYDGNWSGWESLGGVLTSGPTVSSWAPGRLDVFARGTDNAMWHRWYDNNWFGWESLGGTLTSDPAAVSWEKSRIDLFVRGADNALSHKWYDQRWKP